ncbi:MAG: hypothetical protein P0S94_04515 [Simkaniaceae bacterium]|nr:hypothetical protein [Simkaniaceae bacterium]
MNKLNVLLERASSGQGPPNVKIPRQWFPAFLRWPIRILLFPFMMLDIGVQNIAQWIIRPPFKRVGKCHQRGACCHYILFPRVKGPVGWGLKFWATQINGFFLREKQIHYHEGKVMQVYGCRYLRKDGKCGNHRLRPTICRKWPNFAAFGRPQALRGCGFKSEVTKKFQ